MLKQYLPEAHRKRLVALHVHVSVEMQITGWLCRSISVIHEVSATAYASKAILT